VESTCKHLARIVHQRAESESRFEWRLQFAAGSGEGHWAVPADQGHAAMSGALAGREREATNSPIMLLRCKVTSGYRDILLNISDAKSGFVAELQLNFPMIHEIKGKEHRISKLVRVLKLPWII